MKITINILINKVRSKSQAKGELLTVNTVRLYFKATSTSMTH